MKVNRIITISRTYGSGGREIGEKLAKELDIPFYDKNLLHLMSEKTGISEEGLMNADETCALPILMIFPKEQTTVPACTCSKLKASS